MGNDLITKIWENPNPKLEFLAQTINLDLSKHNLFLIVFGRQSEQSSVVGLKNYGTTDCFIVRDYGTDTNNIVLEQRYITLTDNSIIIGNGYQKTTNNKTIVSNKYCIPIAIYSIK